MSGLYSFEQYSYSKAVMMLNGTYFILVIDWLSGWSETFSLKKKMLNTCGRYSFLLLKDGISS